MQPITFEQFQQKTMHGNVIPIAESIVADLLTPVSAFLKMCGDEKDGFLFESVEGGEKVARYSFIGTDPSEFVRFDGKDVIINSTSGNRKVEGDIFQYLKEKLTEFKFVPDPELPRFSGGLVGFFGYDIVRHIEKLPEVNSPLKDQPLASFGLYDTILAFDHLRHEILVITNVFLKDGVNLKEAYDQAREKLYQIRRLLQEPLTVQTASSKEHVNVQSNFQREDFEEAVRTCKEYIKAGDIFQVVLSQRFSRKIKVPPFNIYRALRKVNPSPYLYFVRNEGVAIVGSSPELLVRVENGEVWVRPIAGTRPRGRSEAEDRHYAQDLLADEKERAEHIMLVDLGRNDVGRVSEYGSVQLTQEMIIERYSHVMHIVSEVKGRLRTGLDAIDAFKACFPAGTVSGAPKIRAMEIIEELEPERRGVYSGALGYIDFSGNMDTCIAIRTLEVHGDTAYFQAGAGIVADSVPENEYMETVHKSNALRSALALAENGLEGS